MLKDHMVGRETFHRANACIYRKTLDRTVHICKEEILETNAGLSYDTAY